jgi:hypothetical protein
MGGGENKKILVFMYAREYFKEEESLRKKDIEKMLNKDVSPVLTELKDTPRKRTLRIIEHETDVKKELDPTLEAQTCELIEKYGEHTVFKIHAIKMVQRIQRSGNCFLHAPAMLQGYLVQIGSGEWKGMMDLAKYVRNNFTSQKLSEYIGDLDGDSQDIIVRILDDAAMMSLYPSGPTMKKDLALDSPRLLKHLKKYGPALVAHFSVDAKFKAPSTGEDIPYLSHTFIPEEGPAGHAMVLVGMRRVDKKWRLLLQNWWPDKQLIELSSETIVSSNATLYFATEKQTFIQHVIPTLMDKQAETFVGGSDIPKKNGSDIPKKKAQGEFLLKGTRAARL